MDSPERVQIVSSLTWVCDDRMRRHEGEETYCGGKERSR